MTVMQKLFCFGRVQSIGIGLDQLWPVFRAQGVDQKLFLFRHDLIVDSCGDDLIAGKLQKLTEILIRRRIQIIDHDQDFFLFTDLLQSAELFPIILPQRRISFPVIQQSGNGNGSIITDSLEDPLAGYDVKDMIIRRAMSGDICKRNGSFSDAADAVQEDCVERGKRVSDSG